jgi:trehalose 6-phosphate phosphatase
LLLAFDFDGTLAPIVADPQTAIADPRAVRLLSELSRVVRAVAVISGRDLAFLAGRLPVDRLLLIGNHGLEALEQGQSQVVDEATPYLDPLARAAIAIAQLPVMRSTGARLERKRATLAVHVRGTTDPAAATARLQSPLQQIARDQGLELKPGRLVLELRPPIPVDKGEVLRRLVQESGARAVLYAGDDWTDADAFRALERLATAGVQTVAVGVRSAEVPDDAFVDCDLVVDGVEGVIALLQELRDRFR